MKQIFYALQTKKKEGFITAYKQLLLTLSSYYDLKSENSYHMYLLGMCTWLSKEYEIKSNQEVGKGRCDIILKPRHEKIPGYVFELNYVKEETDLEEVAKKSR